MSLHDRYSRMASTGAVALALMALGVAGCTVRPLYGDVTASTSTGDTPVSGLGGISIKPVNTRYGQELRNQLIFMLNGGSGQPASAPYEMTLAVTAANIRTAVIQVGNEDRATAGAVEMTANYTITDTASGEVVARGRRQVTSSYDRSRQEFAALRAQRDAENRAARELAEFLRLDIAQQMEKKGA